MPGAATIKGGGYKAQRAADGSWTILDVPIFASCRRSFSAPSGATLNLDVDRAWQEKAVGRAQAKFDSGKGYVAPLWVTHKKGERRRIGFVLPTRVGKARAGEEDRDATFADYMGLSDADYADFKAGKYPYVSVEVPVKPHRDPMIEGAALIDEAPYHQFPLQTVSDETGISGTPARAGVLAFRSTEETVQVLARFSMPEDTKDESKKTEEKPGAGAPPVPAATPDAPEGEGSTTGMLTQILTLLKQLIGGPAGIQPAPVAAAPIAMGSFDAKDPESVTAHFQAEVKTLRDENTTLKGRLDAKDRAESKRVAVGAAVKALRGYDVGGDVEALCTAKFDAGGKVALDAFVEGRTAAGDREPDEKWLEAGEAPPESDPILAKFDAEDAPLVATFSREYETIPEGFRKSLTREQYVGANVKRAKALAAGSR